LPGKLASIFRSFSGFEGIALSADDETLYLVLQSPLLNPDKKPGPSAPIHDRSIRAATHRGYNIAKFESDGMSYWAVSDLNPDDLRKLATLLQRPAG
jgi:hypothetical protein